MSVQAITAALAIQGVSSAEKFLLVVLANYADHQMKCWPSQKRLALDLCLSERQVRRLLGSLERRHLIARKDRWIGAGARTSDMITMRLYPPDIMSAPPDIRDIAPRTSATKPPDTMSGKPSITKREPSGREAFLQEEGKTLAPDERERVGAMMRDFASSLRAGKKVN